MCSTCEASPGAAASMCGSIADPHPDGRGFFAVSYHPCHRRKRPDKTRTIMSPSIVIQYLLAWAGSIQPSFAEAAASSPHALSMRGVDPPRPPASVKVFEQRDDGPSRRDQRLPRLPGREWLLQPCEAPHRLGGRAGRDDDPLAEAQQPSGSLGDRELPRSEPEFAQIIGLGSRERRCGQAVLEF